VYEQFVAEAVAAVSASAGEPKVFASAAKTRGASRNENSDVGHFLKRPSPSANLVGYYRKDKTPSALKPGRFSSRLFLFDGLTAALVS